ncbi:MAG TPA: glutamate--tRNA ligase, partial [Gemmatimonadaceae bacterium]|nr:glutamate--tRNA ligase [Gemmatimonadaceae bacterium]
DAAEGHGGHARCACAERGERELPEGSEASVRFRVPPGDPVVVNDMVRGEVRFPRESIEDFVLLRSDGRATYNFAAVVDDAAMRITDVIRGADHLINTPKQLLLYEALELVPPRFAHIPLILGEDRQKLSKRHGATSVGEHRRLGYMPEALVNYLSLLSWSSPSGEEVLPLERLIEEIDLARVGASDAIFDREKLRWLSATYLRELSDEALAERLAGCIDRESFPGVAERGLAVAQALRNRISTFADANAELEHFRSPHSAAQLAARAEVLADPAARAVLAAVRARLAALESWEPEAIKVAIRQGGMDAGAKGKALFQPVRRALTGEDHGPDLPLVAAVLGRDEVLALLFSETSVS